MFQEQSNLNPSSESNNKETAVNNSEKNNTQWKKRVNLFRLVYAYLQTHETENELIGNLDEDDNVNDETFKEQKEILNDVINHYDEYKNQVQQYLKNWSFERISDVDKALFLCALGEYHVLKTDKRILIDQTVITAKRYSGANSYKYINAILDKLLNKTNEKQQKSRVYKRPRQK